MSNDLWQLGEQIADAVGPWHVRLTRSRLSEQGAHVRKRAGIGTDFWQYRPLGDGESRSRIDWRKSARSDDYLVRERERQTPSQVMLWCDRSASMDYHSDPQLMSKRDYAYVLASALVHAASLTDERASALIDAPHLTTKQDLSFRLQEIAEPALHNISADRLIILFSDFLMSDQQLEMLAQAPHDIICVHVCDPSEINFPFSGRIVFTGCEGETDVLLDRAETGRDAYLEAFQARVEKVAAIGYYVCADTSQALIDTARMIIA